eukprot:6194940-Pleurochrysis_carterae.AAC.4
MTTRCAELDVIVGEAPSPPSRSCATAATVRSRSKRDWSFMSVAAPSAPCRRTTDTATEQPSREHATRYARGAVSDAPNAATHTKPY